MKRKLFFLEIGIMLLLASILLIILNSNSEESCLSFTFDDGLESHYTTVFPLLQEKNLSATFFIIANITHDPDPLNRRFMTQSQIKELIKNDFEIGSHTSTHPLLPELTEKEIEKELKESKEILEENYNMNVNSFAFPYSKYNKDILIMARKNYRFIRDETSQIYSFGLKKDTNIKEICDYINYAKVKNRHLSIILHDIIEHPKLWDTSITDFENILKCAEKSRIRIDSLTGCKQEL